MRLRVAVSVLAVGAVLVSPSFSATFTVTKTGNSGAGSLRKAILDSNSNGAADTILFAAALKGKFIRPITALPALTEGSLTINGDIDANGRPDVVLSGARIGGTGIDIRSRNNVIRGLNFRHWDRGIRIFGPGAARNTIAGNYIGTNLRGTWGLSNNVGIYIAGAAAGNTVGGNTAADRNIISGNEGFGVAIRASHRNLIIGNYIGLDQTGKKRLPNSAGVVVYDSENTRIGDGTKSGRNVISANALQQYIDRALEAVADMVAEGPAALPTGGIFIFRGSGTKIRGNYVGTDVTGDIPLGNRWSGIDLIATVSATIGGPNAGHRNLISGNGTGLGAAFCRDTTIVNNYVGTNAKGAARLGNSTAVSLGACDNSTIGGVKPNLRNVISGNAGTAVDIYGGTDNSVLGNYMGVTASGLAALGNGRGIRVGGGARNTWIGNKTNGSGNVVAANDGDGVTVSGDETVRTTITRNIIGRDANGAKVFPNYRTAISVSGDSGIITIGGPTRARGNKISCRSYQNGIALNNTYARDSTIRNNEIFGPGPSFRRGRYGINVDYSYLPRGFTGRISDNIIRRFDEGIRIAGDRTRPTLTGNRISACKNLVMILVEAKPNLGDLQDVRTDNDGGNIFRNPGSYAVYNQTSKYIKAEGNDWDTTSAAAIAILILDKSDIAIYGEVDFDPLIGDTPPDPIPGRPAVQLAGLVALPAPRGAEIAFTLSASAEVSAEILNIAGRLVATLPPRRADAGLNRLSWSGTSAHGTRAPAGIYLVRVLVRDASGSQTSAIAPLRLTR